MTNNFVFVVVSTLALAACQTMGGLTVKDYTAKSGQRVMAGQAEPKAEYSRGANYAYIMAPAQIGIGAVNVNAFSDAQVAYYKCNNLPSGASKGY